MNTMLFCWKWRTKISHSMCFRHIVSRFLLPTYVFIYIQMYADICMSICTHIRIYSDVQNTLPVASDILIYVLFDTHVCTHTYTYSVVRNILPEVSGNVNAAFGALVANIDIHGYIDKHMYLHTHIRTHSIVRNILTEVANNVDATIEALVANMYIHVYIYIYIYMHMHMLCTHTRTHAAL